MTKNVFYDKRPPCKYDWQYPLLTDVNGKGFYLDWSAWIRATEIKEDDDIKLLPEHIAKLLPKWAEEMKIMADEGYYLEYPIKLVCVYFIYDDMVYRLNSEVFNNQSCLKNYQNREVYFQGIHDIIEDDLKKAGCIYTYYSDALD